MNTVIRLDFLVNKTWQIKANVLKYKLIFFTNCLNPLELSKKATNERTIDKGIIIMEYFESAKVFELNEYFMRISNKRENVAIKLIKYRINEILKCVNNDKKEDIHENKT